MIKGDVELMDEIEILEENIEIEFPNIDNVVFKGKWFKKNVRWNDYLMHLVKNVKFCCNHKGEEQSYVFLVVV